MSTEPTLSPCPFCGGAVMFRKALWPTDGCTDAIIHAAPTECGLAQFDLGTIDEGVIAAWNRRAGGEREAWQPIKTAPHGVDVLLFSPADTWGNTTIEVGQASWGWRNSVASNMSYHGYATHWQPLPAPPRAALAGQTEGERNGG